MMPKLIILVLQSFILTNSFESILDNMQEKKQNKTTKNKKNLIL